MPLFGEVFVGELIKMPVLDPMGEDLGNVKDFIVVKGEPLPRVSAILIEKRKKRFRLDWDNIGIFNKRIISSNIYAADCESYEPSEDDLLIARDIFDKQIVDANGAKVVRVNDVKLEGQTNHACLVAVDVGLRGILRRIGIERESEKAYRVFGKTLQHNLIGWGYIQPLEPRLTTISLIVPRQMVSALHPSDLAEIISKVHHEQGISLFKSLDPNVAAEVLHELEPKVKRAIIESLDKEHATDVVERMPPDEAADLMSDLESDKAKELLESIEKDEAEDIQELLAHEEDTAGGIMTNQFIAYPPDLTVQEAIERLRLDSPNVETVYYIYIVEGERLIGIASLRDLILSSPNIRLSEIMEKKTKTVSPDTNQQAVAELISKYNHLALPVVDAEHNLLGIVTIDDIVDILLPPSSRKKRRSV